MTCGSGVPCAGRACSLLSHLSGTAFTYGGLSVAEQNALLQESTGITSALGNMLGELSRVRTECALDWAFSVTCAEVAQRSQISFHHQASNEAGLVSPGMYSKALQASMLLHFCTSWVSSDYTYEDCSSCLCSHILLSSPASAPARAALPPAVALLALPLLPHCKQPQV